MASARVFEITDDNFEAEVLAAPVPTLVEFWAVWSAPSRALAPTVEKLAVSYPGKLRAGRLDIDRNQGTTEAYGIRSVPTLLLFKNGEVVESIVGAHPYDRIAAEIVPNL